MIIITKIIIIKWIIKIIVQYLSDYSILTLKALHCLMLPETLPTAELDFAIVITWFRTVIKKFFLAFAKGVSDGGLANWESVEKGCCSW